jgi:hypothetical protein
MSTILQGAQLRQLVLGNGVVSKASGTLDEDVVVTLFTVTGGEVLITGLWAKVTTAITVANTVTVQANPTTGDTAVFVTGDLGTTDTAAGTVLGGCKQTDGATDWQRNGPPIEAIVSTGTVELDSTGTDTDGALTVYCTWVPLTAGATLVAA